MTPNRPRGPACRTGLPGRWSPPIDEERSQSPTDSASDRSASAASPQQNFRLPATVTRRSWSVPNTVGPERRIDG